MYGNNRRRKHKKKTEPSLLVAKMGQQKENNPTADNFISELQSKDDNKVEKLDKVQDNHHQNQHQHPEDFRKLYLAIFILYILITCVTFLSIKFIFNGSCLFKCRYPGLLQRTRIKC